MHTSIEQVMSALTVESLPHESLPSSTELFCVMTMDELSMVGGGGPPVPSD